MRVYEVVIGETVSRAMDHLLIKAGSLMSAAQKADVLKRKKYYYDGWRITSVKEIGELER